MEVDLAAIAHVIRKRFDADLSMWDGSPFEWLRMLSSSKKGAAFEMLFKAWASHHGCNVSKTRGSDSDCAVDGVKTEIKGSMLWEGGIYQFNQIRRQDYDQIALVGISPHSSSVWVVPKEVALEHSIPQHMGRSGSDTFLLRFKAEDPPLWLDNFHESPPERCLPHTPLLFN